MSREDELMREVTFLRELVKSQADTIEKLLADRPTVAPTPTVFNPFPWVRPSTMPFIAGGVSLPQTVDRYGAQWTGTNAPGFGASFTQ